MLHQREQKHPKVALRYESPFSEPPLSSQKLKVLRDLETGKPKGFVRPFKYYQVSFTPRDGLTVKRAPSGYCESLTAQGDYYHEPGGTVIPAALFRREVLNAAAKNPEIAAFVNQNSKYFM